MNKTKKTKVSGFTIAEIIIALMLSAILTGIVVKLYEYISETFRANDKNLSGYEAVLNFEQLLSKSMEDADSVHFFPDDALKFYKNEIETSFLFSDSAVIYRNRKPADTFFIKVSEITSAYHISAPSLLVSLNINVLHYKHIIALEFIKEYDGETIVKSQLRSNEN